MSYEGFDLTVIKDVREFMGFHSGAEHEEDGVSLQDAEKVAERLRDRVAKTSVSEALSVTCSFGVSSIESTDSLELAMSQADSALYKSKAAGRNRVSIYSG